MLKVPVDDVESAMAVSYNLLSVDVQILAGFVRKKKDLASIECRTLLEKGTEAKSIQQLVQDNKACRDIRAHPDMMLKLILQNDQACQRPTRLYFAFQQRASELCALLPGQGTSF